MWLPSPGRVPGTTYAPHVLPTALDPDALRSITIVVLALVVLCIFLTLRFVQKVVVRLVLLALLVAFGAAVWVQRDDLRLCRSAGSCTFFGQEVQVPDPALG